MNSAYCYLFCLVVGVFLVVRNRVLKSLMRQRFDRLLLTKPMPANIFEMFSSKGVCHED